MNDRPTGTFRLSRTRNGKLFYFNLYASNGQCLVTSEIYNTRAAMLKGMTAVQRLAADARIDDLTTRP